MMDTNLATDIAQKTVCVMVRTMGIENYNK